ncbi:MAG: amidohydrolase family protein, partial [Burkholderiaceae bacterium]
MRLLLLPVLLRRGGFNGAPLDERQARFAIDLPAYGRLLEQLAGRARRDPLLTVGVAPQSLRGVSHEDLQALLALRAAILPDCPVHLHIAGDEAEIDDSIVHTGARPIEWLCAHFDVDRHWVLVHATHATPQELARLAERRAVVCLCATTEANQGLGTFDMASWWPTDGALAIGSDSNVTVSAGEELRWIEYTTRLLARQRSRLVTDQNPHPGSALWRRAVSGGRQAMGCPHPGIAVGAPADLLAIHRDDKRIKPDEALDDLVFTQRMTHAEMIDV